MTTVILNLHNTVISKRKHKDFRGNHLSISTEKYDADTISNIVYITGSDLLSYSHRHLDNFMLISKLRCGRMTVRENGKPFILFSKWN